MICKSALSPRASFHSMAPEDGGEEPDLFRPLYQSLGCAASQSSVEADPQALIEEAREKGFQEGLKKGQAEAREMLRSSMMPGLNAFQKNCNDLAASDGQIQERAGLNITALAVAIAERILNAPVSLNLDRLPAVIQTALAEASRWSVNIHSNDFQLLRKMFPEAGLEWTARMDRLLQPSDSVQPGEVRIQDHTELRSLFEEKIIQGLSELLA